MNGMSDVLLIQFAREPVPGKVKTRMLPELSPDQACDLHRDLVLWTSRTLTGARLGRVELHVAGSPGNPLFLQCEALGVSALVPQEGENLGERMYRALLNGLERYSKVILVGSDSPQIDRDYLTAAINLLDGAEAVLGPAADGGYVLIGVRRLDSGWFEGVDWGSDTVLADTVARIEASGTCWQSLAVLQDIDRPEDLPVWRAIVENHL